MSSGKMSTSESSQADQNKRFGDVTEAGMNKLLREKKSQNTQRATATAVRDLRAYLLENNLPVAFEELDAVHLDEVLAKFYTEARTEKGSLYKKTSLFSLRHGLNRHLQSTDPSIDLINGKDFRASQLSFKAMCKELKREGMGGIDHHPPVDKGDLEKLYRSFDLCDPQSLQAKVFVDILLYLARRGRENLRELKISDFSCTSDPNGTMYIYMDKDELTKNHDSDPNTAKGRMYEIQDNELCPVRSFVEYKRMLCPRCPYLFQRVREGPTEDGCYFECSPVGHNNLSRMMSVLSVKAGLSQVYTNHSLRATAVHILDVAEFPSRHFMTVTGHKSETSLKTYTGYTDDGTKKRMSNTISQITVGSRNVKQELQAQNANVAEAPDILDTVNTNDLIPLSNSQVDNLLNEFDADNDFDDVIRAMPPSMSNPTSAGKMVSTNYHLSVPYQQSSRQWPTPIITGNNANVTINYQIFQK